MTVRIPAWLGTTATELGLRNWVGSSVFPLDKWCETIDGIKELFRQHNNLEPTPKRLIPTLVGLVDDEGLLESHVELKEIPVDNEDHWLKMCEAAAWVIYQAYERRVERGEWPPQ